MPTRLTIAKPDLVRLFQGMPKRSYRQRDLARILEENRGHWRLAQSMTVAKFIKYLVDNTDLRTVRLSLPYRPETIYTWGELSVYQIAVAAKPGAYLSHLTAMSVHELTVQVPKTVYVNMEQRPQLSDPGSLAQERIDHAFRRPQRITSNFATYKGYRLVYINGKHTDSLGVEQHVVAESASVPATNLERTLIDIAVRPRYSGGVAEVAQAYERAKARVSVNRLAAFLSKMEFVYPYQQVIGYYLERAEVKASLLDLFRREPFRFDFYLDYAMKETDYVGQWRLHVPKGF